MRNRIQAGFALSILLVCLVSVSMAQVKWDLTAGAGFPEFVNVGAAYQLNQSQVAISGIMIPFAEGLIFTLSADYYRNFGGTSKLSKRKPWYLRSGLNYNSSGNKEDYQRLMYLNIRLGRDFNFSTKIGMAVDIGPGFRLMKQSNDIDDTFDLAEPVIPSFGAHLFYRL